MIKIKCKQCDKEYKIYPYELKISKYCSKKCMGEGYKDKVKVNCDNCGKIIEKIQSQIKKHNFCSTKCMGIWQSQNAIGVESRNWKGGKPQKYCLDCGKPIDKRGRTERCHKCNSQRVEVREKLSEINKGEKHPRWQGGIADDPYPDEWTKELRERIKKRDNYTCQKCGKTEAEQLKELNRKLGVHHIDYDKMNCKPENLITLCGSCNSKVNNSRLFWTGFFMGQRFRILYKGEEVL